MRQPHFLLRLILSFLAVAIGWAISLALSSLYLYLRSGDASLDPLLGWSAGAVLLAWAFIVVPLVLIAHSKLPLASVLRMALLGATVASITSALLVAGIYRMFGVSGGWWTDYWTPPFFPAFAFITGSVAGVCYATGIRLSSPPSRL